MSATERKVIERLVAVSSPMLDDVIARLHIETTVWPQLVVDARSAIAEANAALSSVDQSRGDLSSSELAKIACDTLSRAVLGPMLKTTWKDNIDIDVLRAEVVDFLRAVIAADRAILRNVPDTPGMVIVPTKLTEAMRQVIVSHYASFDSDDEFYELLIAASKTEVKS